MPGNVTLVVEMRNRHPSLFESRWSHCDCWPCRWPVALSVGAGLAGGVGVQEYRESRDAVNGSLQRGDLGKSLATEVMVQSDAQGVEGLVVVHDALSLTHIGSHSSSFRAYRSIALLGLAVLWVARAAG